LSLAKNGDAKPADIYFTGVLPIRRIPLLVRAKALVLTAEIPCFVVFEKKWKNETFWL